VWIFLPDTLTPFIRQPQDAFRRHNGYFRQADRC
jgi:hypothetical protein